MKHFVSTLVLAAAVMGLAPLAVAGEAHICTSRPFVGVSTQSAKTGLPFLVLDDRTVFACAAPIGKKTIPQLAALGWHVTMPVEIPGEMTPGTMGPPPFTWKVLIQKP